MKILASGYFFENSLIIWFENIFWCPKFSILVLFRTKTKSVAKKAREKSEKFFQWPIKKEEIEWIPLEFWPQTLEAEPRLRGVNPYHLHGSGVSQNMANLPKITWNFQEFDQFDARPKRSLMKELMEGKEASEGGGVYLGCSQQYVLHQIINSIWLTFYRNHFAFIFSNVISKSDLVMLMQDACMSICTRLLS